MEKTRQEKIFMIGGDIKEAADNICKEINRYKKEIFENIKKEDIAIYLWLMDAYNQGEYLRDRSKYPFQIVFKFFYGMNRAGLSKNAVEKFFELLENKPAGLAGLKEILNELCPLCNNRVQFSFATKLLHTADCHKPIFDSNVSAAIHRQVHGNNQTERIESCLNIYKYLIDLYSQLVADDGMQKTIKEFKKEKSVSGNISDEKIFDFFLWSLGKNK